MDKKLITLLAIGAMTVLVGCSNSNNIQISNQVKKTVPMKEVIKQRQITGKTVDLGAGTFTVGTDIEAGTYDLTPNIGQEGKITVTSPQIESDISLGCTQDTLGFADATNSDNMGISKMRLKLVKGDTIDLNGVNKTQFKPITTPFVSKTPKETFLYAGRFVTGEDIAPGRYKIVATKGNGAVYIYNDNMQSQQLISDQKGDYTTNDPKSATITLKNGNPIFITGIEQVDFVPIQ